MSDLNLNDNNLNNQKELFEKDLQQELNNLNNTISSDNQIYEKRFKDFKRKFKSKTLICLLFCVILVLSSKGFVSVVHKSNTKEVDTKIANMLLIAVRQCYSKEGLYPIDVDKKINIEYLEKKGYLTTDVETISSTEFIYQDNKVIPIY